MKFLIGSYLDDYKEEINELIKQGKSVRTIARILNTNHPNLEATKSTVHDWIKKQQKPPNEFEKTMERSGFELPFELKYGWLKTKEASLFIKNNADVVSLDQVIDDLSEDLRQYTPKRRKIVRKPVSDPHMLVIDIADLHIGKLADKTETGEQYNNDIAMQRALDGVQGLINKASGFPIDQILFVIGNDVLHTDNASATSTKGTPQDVTKRFHANFIDAKNMYVRAIEMLLEIADIHVVHNPSNHDFISGFMLAHTIEAYFHTSKNMTWDISNRHRKYFRYGKSLIGTEHGDGVKNISELPLLMANETGQDWADSYWRYIYLHHVHHKDLFKFRSSKDYAGCTVEYMRSPSSADAWHAKSGYQHAPKAIEGFIHSKEFGQVARLTHLFR